MIIGMVTTSYPRYEGDAAGQFVREMARGFVEKGHRVEVVAPSSDPPSRCCDPSISLHPFGSAWVTERLFYSPGAPEALERNRWLWSAVPPAVLAMGREVLNRSRRWDAVVSHWLVPSGILTALSAVPVPHLAWAHSADVHLLRQLPFRDLLVELLLRRSVGLAFTCSFGLNRLAESLRPKQSARLAERSIIQPMGVRLSEVSSRARSDPPGTVALFLGRLVEVKRPDWIVRLAKRLTDVTFVVAGRGPEMRSLERDVVRGGLAGRVRLVGEVGGKRKSELLAMADLLVLPSGVRSSGRTEGVPVSVLEAMAAAVPVVATDVGGVGEVVTDGSEGFLVPPDDFDGMVAAVKRLHLDPYLRKRLGASARRKAANYDWAAVVSRLEGLLRL